MARLARIVVPGKPHHVTRRGNRRLDVFFGDDDYRAYLDLPCAASDEAGTEVWAYCLMPNHVHPILAPRDADGPRAVLGDAHRRWRINARDKWTAHPWQGRFGSVAMDEEHLVHALRDVVVNPVRAKLVTRAADWPWSSVPAHLSGQDDMVTARAVVERLPDFAALLERSKSITVCRAGRKPSDVRSVARPGLTGSRHSSADPSDPKNAGQKRS